MCGYVVHDIFVCLLAYMPWSTAARAYSDWCRPCAAMDLALNQLPFNQALASAAGGSPDKDTNQLNTSPTELAVLSDQLKLDSQDSGASELL